MPSGRLLPFEPRHRIRPQGFCGRAATTSLHDGGETGLRISGIFEAAEDFGNVRLFRPMTTSTTSA
jgi:hypothetical protein